MVARKQFSLKVFGDNIGHGRRSPAQQAIHIFLAQIANRASGLQHSPEIASAGAVDIRRS